MSYRPPEKILEKYARVLVNFALNNGQGVKKGEVVFLQVSEAAKPLLIHLRRQALLAGAYPIIQYLPEGLEREFYELAKKDQLIFFPKKYLRGIVEQADHFISVLSETNKYELEGMAPQKILQRAELFPLTNVGGRQKKIRENSPGHSPFTPRRQKPKKPV